MPHVISDTMPPTEQVNGRFYDEQGGVPRGRARARADRGRQREAEAEAARLAQQGSRPGRASRRSGNQSRNYGHADRTEQGAIMTDTAAPDAGAPASAPAAPASSEVVINQNPTTPPAPVGPQAPPKPPESAGSRREPRSSGRSIARGILTRRSRSRLTPRSVTTSRPRRPRLSGRSRRRAMAMIRTVSTSASARASSRGTRAGSHHAPRSRAEIRQLSAAPGAEQRPQQSARPAAKQLPEAPRSDPPQRMKDHATAAWDKAPESVRADAHRMYREFDQAFQRTRSRPRLHADNPAVSADGA